VPQTQRYCAGDWATWDPKITTLPGLYVLGAAAGHAAHAALSLAGAAGAAGPCSPTQLRAVNVLLATALIPVFWHLAAALDPSRTPAQLALLAAAAALFPLHFFFTFLYYTDVASTLLMLAAWLAAVKRRRGLAAALGAAAVAVRQTNAVWVAFVLGWGTMDLLMPAVRIAAAARAAPAAKMQAGRRVAARPADRASNSAAVGGGGAAGREGGTLEDAELLVRGAWVLRSQVASRMWPLAAVLAAFAAFLAWNGGVAVGDRANHGAVRHLAQPLYLALYATLALAPAFWTPAALGASRAALRRRAKRAPWATLAALAGAAAAAAGAVGFGTLVHPFLLADNRHYTFYLWRRVVGAAPWARYALIPAYLHSLGALRRGLAHRHPLRAALLGAAACLVVVPAHLVELRYFTLPVLAALLLLRTPPPRQLAAVVALWAAADAAALWVFLARPFVWGDGSVARFLW
jgi:alpha-1,2-glucosyltransferase